MGAYVRTKRLPTRPWKIEKGLAFAELGTSCMLAPYPWRLLSLPYQLLYFLLRKITFLRVPTIGYLVGLFTFQFDLFVISLFSSILLNKCGFFFNFYFLQDGENKLWQWMQLPPNGSPLRFQIFFNLSLNLAFVYHFKFLFLDGSSNVNC